MGLQERIAARAAAKAAEKKAAARAARRAARTASVITPIKDEPPDQTAAAVAQTDPQIFRDDEARAKQAAEINAARAAWAAGPAPILAGVR
jgi:hypothetical protein